MRSSSASHEPLEWEATAKISGLPACPTLHGHGGEEAEALAEAGIPFDVVRGVTAMTAVPAYAGIPLTHRKLSSFFAVVTGHDCAKDRPGVDWAGIVTAVDTLLVLMAGRTLPRIARELIAHGRSADTPVAMIHSGTTEAQATITAALGDVADGIELEAPVVAVIVVALRECLDGFDAAAALQAALAV